MRKYYTLPHGHVARIHRVASNSVAKAIVLSHYYGLKADVNSGLSEDIRLNDGMIWQAIAPQTEEVHKDIFMLFRDPVDRFLSISRMYGLSVDEAIVVAKDNKDDAHFFSQASYMAKNVASYVYRFPEQIKQFCEHTKICFPLPDINFSLPKMYQITKEQKQEIENIYDDDVFLSKKLAGAI